MTEAKWIAVQETIVGYVGPMRGGNNRDTKCVALYWEGAQYHCCLVYEDEEAFHDLPFGIAEKMLESDFISGRAPEVDDAKFDGTYQSCPPFGIEVYHEPQPDGSTKNKKKLVRVLPTHEQAAQASERTAGVPAGDVGSLEFNPVSDDVLSSVFTSIVSESANKLYLVLQEVERTCDAFEDNEKAKGRDTAIHSDARLEFVKMVWFEAGKVWTTVRPHYLHQASETSLPFDASSASLKVKDGEPEQFLKLVAEGHPHIIDADHAKAVFNTLGVTGVPPSVERRVLLANRAWMYLDLVSRQRFDKPVAAATATSLFPDEAA